jgi:hypothetical protein
VEEGISLSTSGDVENSIHCGWVLERDRAAIDAALDDHMEIELRVTGISNRTASRWDKSLNVLRIISFGGGQWTARIAIPSDD